MTRTLKKWFRPAITAWRNAKPRKHVQKLLSSGDPVWLNLAAGNRKGSRGWVTIDLRREADINWDLRYGIPFPDGTVSKIYTSHFMEHLSYQEGQAFLDECLRVLKPGGVFSVCVPNARIYIEAYMGAELEGEEFFSYQKAYNHTTRIDMLNYTAYMDGEHKYMFDEENLIHILSAKGFKTAAMREFDPDIDLEKRRFESMYAEAIK